MIGRNDTAPDKIWCGPGDDMVVYVGTPDPADALGSCETVVELPIP